MSEDSFAADRRLIESLWKRSKLVSLSEGSILFSQGDSPKGLYIVESGEVALTMTSEQGRVTMTLHAGPGSILGLPAVFGDQAYSLTAIAVKGSVIGFVSRGEFDDVVRADPSLYPYVLQVLAAEVRAARQAVTDWEGRPGGR